MPHVVRVVAEKNARRVGAISGIVMHFSAMFAFACALAICASCSIESLSADCNGNTACDHIQYGVNYFPGTGYYNCTEFSSNSSDALLGPNNTAYDDIWSQNPIGGEKTAHPTIQVKWRMWPDCTTECGGFSSAPATLAFLKVTSPLGTAGNWSNWIAAHYCDEGG